MAESKSSEPRVQMNPVVQVAVNAIGKNKKGQPELSDAGKKQIAEALEFAAGDDTIVEGLFQLLAFAGYLDTEHKQRDLAVQIIEIAAPWGPIMAQMAENLQDPTGSTESVQRIREVATALARKQAVRAPMVNEKKPEGAVRSTDLYIPRQFRM